MAADVSVPRPDHPTAPTTPRRGGTRSNGGAISMGLLAVLVAVSLVWVGAVAVVASGGHLPNLTIPTGSSSTSSGSPKPAYLYFTITTSATTAFDTFYPANVSVPVNQPVVVSILNYDPGVNNVSSPYNQVVGTVGGQATYNFTNGQRSFSATALTNGNISHTFTIVFPGAASRLQVQAGTPVLTVPIPPSPNGIDAATATFTMEFTSTGHYVWTCLAPCDPYSMNTPGFMIGSIDVV